MRFNKNEFKKVNDKKVLKKVKKQWVTVSIATLAFLGGSALYTSTSSVKASADDGVTMGELSNQNY
ncbi:KxYKxGKxW signal peptide domain-containing protein [Apilactobacillus ozensis]|uniref:KxYKxGKxW signal peptide domain-containing protein n=1 Tax=Apilactobacillus ozensis TaxID=866801 RepID=UPI00200A2BBE|nr:KxYKxGKxW signal peptide domain-containing protein [Apilactobacillus ozensis]MCK8607124.1 KxYKxGKxW signal peptide domain-containing protein [Apilactobacillus ozensis]